MISWKDILEYIALGNPKPRRTIQKSEEEWRVLLGDERYRIMRQKGTERAYSSDLCSLFEPGRYRCAGCDELLFDAKEKFESSSGWPSFTQPVSENAIAYHKDSSYGMIRVETTCNCCGGHLGHVFPDGPPPSGLRYCMNALALKKVEE